MGLCTNIFLSTDGTYQPLTDHLPTTYRPPANRLPTTYWLLTNHLSTMYWPPTDHLQTTYRPLNITTYRPPNNHLLTTYQPPTNHVLTTYWPSTDHLPTTYQLPTNHLLTTYQPPTNHVLTTYQPCSDHLPTTYGPPTDHFFTVQLVHDFHGIKSINAGDSDSERFKVSREAFLTFSFNQHSAQNIRVTLNKVYIFLKLSVCRFQISRLFWWKATAEENRACYLRNERLCEPSLLSRALWWTDPIFIVI